METAENFAWRWQWSWRWR